jgi:hypothetical protein
MKLIAAVAFLMFALIAPSANARQVCNHDPVCQAKRDGVSVEQARSRQNQQRRSGSPRAVRGDCRMDEGHLLIGCCCHG